jgi:glycerol-3-phosphate O-acyltransferase
LRNHDELDDLLLVPVTINYDKIYEGQQFPFELLGDVSKRESVLKMFGSIFWINEQYGRVHVKYCKPISLKEKVSEYAKTAKVDTKLLLCKQEES